MTDSHPADAATPVRDAPTIDSARNVMGVFYRWFKGLDCAGAPEAGFFEEWYDRLRDAEKAGDATFVETARDAVADTLRYLHLCDQDEWLPIAASLNVEVRNV